MSPWSLVFAGASPGGGAARLTVTMYHRVVPAADPLFPEVPDPARFETELRRLRSWFNVLPLAEAIERLDDGTLPARPLCITFDDGYADNQAVALPILEQLGLNATVFVSTGFLDGGRMWNDTVIESVRRFEGDQFDLESLGLGVYPTSSPAARRGAIERLLPRLKYLPPAERQDRVERIAALSGAELPNDLMLSSAQLKNLRSRGMGIGAHTVSHPILTSLDRGVAQQEMAASKERLESLLGERIDFFAYPNGKPGDDYAPEHAEIARSVGFRAAFSTVAGAVRRGSDRYQLPRFTPWGPTPTKVAMQFLRNLSR